jgi:hypothetical protein
MYWMSVIGGGILGIVTEHDMREINDLKEKMNPNRSSMHPTRSLTMYLESTWSTDRWE